MLLRFIGRSFSEPHSSKARGARAQGCRRTPSRTPRRPPAGIALQARAVAYQGEIPALSTSLSFVALCLGLRALLRCGSAGFGAGVGTREGQGGLFELLGGGEFLLGLGFQRGGAGDFGARLAA